MSDHAIYVQDNGNVYYVGERHSRTEAEATADIYNRDPLSRGFFYVISKRAIRDMARERSSALAALDV